MRLHTAACLSVTLFVGVSGCTTPHASTRGQSVEHTGHHDHHRVNTLPNRSGNVSSIQDYFEDKHVYGNAASYQSTSGFPGYSGFAASGAYGAAGHGGCPHGTCPPGQCGHGCGSGGHGCIGHPHHYHAYSYERPGDLVYPGPNAVGGSVVYPYYTHKGPSDFFRDDCR
jgi:hypothetical protein